MNCWWCFGRPAVAAVKPIVGPTTPMCEACKKRVGKRDGLGNYQEITVEEFMRREHPEPGRA